MNLVFAQHGTQKQSKARIRFSGARGPEVGGQGSGVGLGFKVWSAGLGAESSGSGAQGFVFARLWGSASGVQDRGSELGFQGRA